MGFARKVERRQARGELTPRPELVELSPERPTARIVDKLHATPTTWTLGLLSSVYRQSDEPAGVRFVVTLRVGSSAMTLKRAHDFEGPAPHELERAGRT